MRFPNARVWFPRATNHSIEFELGDPSPWLTFGVITRVIHGVLLDFNQHTLPSLTRGASGSMRHSHALLRHGSSKC